MTLCFNIDIKKLLNIFLCNFHYYITKSINNFYKKNNHYIEYILLLFHQLHKCNQTRPRQNLHPENFGEHIFKLYKQKCNIIKMIKVKVLLNDKICLEFYYYALI